MQFSVLIPVYNRVDPNLFKIALNSINENTAKPAQVVLVVDGPINTDLENAINGFATEVYEIVRLPDNRGIVEALNYGLKFCRYELVARCDSDDRNILDRFEKQLTAFKGDDKLCVCGGQVVEIIQQDSFLKYVPLSATEISHFIKFRNPFNHMTVMFRKSAIFAAGGYREFKYR